MYMLWFNFILGLNFIFFCFKLITIHYHTQKRKKIKFKPRIKLNHNIYPHTCILKSPSQGAKKIIFTACHSGKLKLAFTSPDVISTSPKSFSASGIDFTLLLFFEFLKEHHLPLGPRAIGHYFLCTLLYIEMGTITFLYWHLYPLKTTSLLTSLNLLSWHVSVQ